MEKLVWIGIDTGVKTGVAVWDSYRKEFLEVRTMTITAAMEMVLVYWHQYGSGCVRVVVEDARKRKWFGDSGREVLQGVGSVKRDAGIWEDWCGEVGICCEFVAPCRNLTKLDAVAFKRITGWRRTTTEHSRDAAMLVYGR